MSFGRLTIMLAVLRMFTASPSPENWNFRLNDLAGVPHSVAEWQYKRAVVLLFLATDCPISSRYAPTLNRMISEYGAKKIAFYIVQSDPDLTVEAARKYAGDFAFKTAMLLDPAQTLAAKTQVKVTPTAVVLK